MILELDKIIVKEIGEKDSEGILAIYNSNKEFLQAHLDKKQIKHDWVIDEIETMKRLNFKRMKIVEKGSNNVIGFLDIKIEEECYLSLLIIHSEYKNMGYGKMVYDALEDYFRKENVKNVRIDVVHDYNNAVMEFWLKRGFNTVKNIQLRWDDQYLGAALMKKAL